MKRILTTLATAALAAVVLTGTTACTSIRAREPLPWRSATALVLAEGSAQEQRLEGAALKTYLQRFVPDERTGFRLVHRTRSGHLLIDGKRYLVNVAVEQVAGDPELLTIHAGAEKLHLRQQ